MATLKLLLFLFIIFLSATVPSSLSYEPRNHEVEALISLKNDLNDPHGVLNNWDEDSVDPCSWAMIICSPENFVIGLGAPSQSLSGTLSERISYLTNLKQVFEWRKFVFPKWGCPLEGTFKLNHAYNAIIHVMELEAAIAKESN